MPDAAETWLVCKPLGRAMATAKGKTKDKEAWAEALVFVSAAACQRCFLQRGLEAALQGEEPGLY